MYCVALLTCLGVAQLTRYPYPRQTKTKKSLSVPPRDQRTTQRPENSKVKMIGNDKKRPFLGMI